MLVLSRKRNEAIVIDPTKCPRDEQGRIVITVIEVRGDKARLGVDAPRAMSVHRQEIQDDVDRRAVA